MVPSDKTKCIMVQGTASNAGKSVVVAALCRIYSQRGYRVAPFKSQNMSLNSFTTQENREIAMAQVLQAEAAGVEPHHHMNPVLLKPKEDFTSQVIVHGKPAGDMNFYHYQHNFRNQALKAIKESLDALKKDYDVIIMEGAGSPAEINMLDLDLANMQIARLADADVILVADIDKGGVFASIAGTFQLLPPEDRQRIKGIIINKFRGNLDILMPGIRQIEEIVGVPVLGVLPYDPGLKLPEEDSASLSERKYRGHGKITVGVMRLPRISNFTDIDPLEYEPEIGVKLIEIGDEIGSLDALIIPGTRNSISDMVALDEAGFTDEIQSLSHEIPVFGICGGYQMLGTEIIDTSLKESSIGSIKGMGILDVKTIFGEVKKVISQSKGTLMGNGMFADIKGEMLNGYELHEGISYLGTSKPLLKVLKGCGNYPESGFDGAQEGLTAGTYFHGIFHNFSFRRSFTDHLRENKGLERLGYHQDHFQELKKFSIQRLSDLVENNLDMRLLQNVLQCDI
ncbi:cobyric acid synthase CobQ [Methanobacterium ferruginis]|uniref:cobyric acid synthase CobQ n=1 Tax=Methanobacterium ferruginis TaxID=710191 RepID=UPI0025732CD1|nr:cobyric acid synthase CobQ [Methanobacterium ferruginis]BDZ67976.1 cobyric acid synthase CobQ [Methanobacterium ferruginis]